MGLEQSKSLAQMDAAEVAIAVEELGSQYLKLAQAIRENAVDGPFLLSLNPSELEETMDDLGVTARLHRRVLEKKIFAAAEQGTSKPTIISWALEEDHRENDAKKELRRASTLTEGARNTMRSQKSFEQKEAETKKLLEIMRVAAEQQMLERYALLRRESELEQQVKMFSATNHAA